MEGDAAQDSDPTYPTIQLHYRQELDGLVVDHRRNGPTSLRHYGEGKYYGLQPIVAKNIGRRIELS